MNFKIKEICDQKGISVAELGRMIGLSKSGIHSILNNGNPTVDTLSKIAKSLDVDITELFENGQEEGVLTCPNCRKKFKAIG